LSHKNVARKNKCPVNNHHAQHLLLLLKFVVLPPKLLLLLLVSVSLLLLPVVSPERVVRVLRFVLRCFLRMKVVPPEVVLRVESVQSAGRGTLARHTLGRVESMSKDPTFLRVASQM
jgi:hypothetical protein